MIFSSLLSLLLIIFIIFFMYYLVAFFTGAPFLPTPKHIVREMTELANIRQGDNIADIGSGDGRLLIAAAQKGAKATGWEINPVLVLWSQLTAYYLGLGKKVVVHCMDYRKANLKAFNKLFLYSISDKINFIEKLILSNMAKGSLVISYKFALPHLRLKFKTPSDIYVYSV